MKNMESDNFEMDVSLSELVAHNDTCKINTNSSRHFESYSGILLYVTHPHEEERFTVQLGVDETGIVYEGDYGCRPEYKEIPIRQGLKILMAYKELINNRRDLEMLLIRNRTDNDIVHVRIV